MLSADGEPGDRIHFLKRIIRTLSTNLIILLLAACNFESLYLTDIFLNMCHL